MIDARQANPIETSSPDGRGHAVVAGEAPDRTSRTTARGAAAAARTRATSRRGGDGPKTAATCEVVTHAAIFATNLRAGCPRTSPRADKSPSCTWRSSVWFTGTSAPTFMRMCLRRLSVTCICGATSQVTAASLGAELAAPSTSTIGEYMRPKRRRDQAPAQRRPPEDLRDWRRVEVDGKVGARVRLHEARRRAEVWPHATKGSRTVTPAPRPRSARPVGTDTSSPSERMLPVRRAVHERVLQRERRDRRVPPSSRPGGPGHPARRVREVQESERDAHLESSTRAPRRFLVDELVHDAARAPQRDRRRQHHSRFQGTPSR